MVELTVVNQWHAVTRMYVELSLQWAILYFYMFCFVSVLIVTNVLTAFIFDAFIIQFDAAQAENAEQRTKRSRQKKLELLSEQKQQKRLLRQRRQLKKHSKMRRRL